MTILQVESQTQLNRLIKFGETEFKKYDENVEILKSIKLKDRILELIQLYLDKADALSNSLRAGEIEIRDFQLELIQYLTDLYSFIVIDTKAPVGFYISEFEFELPYIIRFGMDIQNSRMTKDERLNYRASLYIFSAWVLYQAIEQYWAKQSGKTQERIVCDGEACEEYKTDWQRIGISKRINDNYVGKKCWCEYQFE